MDADYLHEIIQKKPDRPCNDYQSIRDYYDIAGPDYETWSRNFNMHFGYCKKFTDIFFLEKMLINMNDIVMCELRINPVEKTEICDLGCGVGTVARHLAKKLPFSRVTGVTISDYQIFKGRSFNQKENLEKSVTILKNNFEYLDFENSSFNHVYALESACHAFGSGKELFISEMTRILKPGGSFCIADGFLKHNKKTPRLFRFLYNKIIKYWALPCFGNIQDVAENLEKQGMTDIKIREISYRIAASVAYIPWTSFKFFIKEIRKNKSLLLKKERWHNVVAPLLGMILGLYRKHFGYYIISGKKSDKNINTTFSP